ncbi:MAG: radical SAM protein, partial [Deltaproteobacteria bacterium]|nr:radical SAM protein [Deltaproteobacteria bacterium]
MMEASVTIQEDQERFESPEYVRMSLAAAMTLGFKPGFFYRKARLDCINLLLTYRGGCAARCAYCGLSNKRPGPYGRKSFIRVTWPTCPVHDIIERISGRLDRVKRICISMITNKRAVRDTKNICARLRSSFDVPVSLLISPTILCREDLVDFKGAGADKIGVAIDLATPALFDRFRGAGVSGPHQWKTYWDCLNDAIDLFGEGNAGSHFMVGMGETEKEMCEAIQKVRDMGGGTHLFSFFPESDSTMATHPVPPMAQYRRIQLARYLIDQGISREGRF